MYKTMPKFTVTGFNESERLVQVFGSENLKTVSGIVRKTEKLVNEIIADFDLYKMYLKGVYYVVICDNLNNDNIVYRRKLSDIIDGADGVVLLEKALEQKLRFAKEDPKYYTYLTRTLNEKCFLELRSFNVSLNELCLEIEKVINEYISNGS